MFRKLCDLCEVKGLHIVRSLVGNFVTSIEHPELFMVQLHAILRASQGRNVGILLPMVSSSDEIREARGYLTRAQRELKNENVPFDDGVKLGIMVEVPAAAFIAERLTGEVDFMSIGTNDLSQYVMSADRCSGRVSSLCDALHPAVLHLIQLTARACHASGNGQGSVERWRGTDPLYRCCWDLESTS